MTKVGRRDKPVINTLQPPNFWHAAAKIHILYGVLRRHGMNPESGATGSKPSSIVTTCFNYYLPIIPLIEFYVDWIKFHV
jgi:hypothetical protein